MSLPLGELFDLLTAFAVRSGRRKLKNARDDADDGQFWALMEAR